MALKETDTKAIVGYVKKGPRTIQEISKLIKKSWVTTDSYVKQIKEQTGLIDCRTFRAGSKAALKIVFYNYSDSISSDDLKENLYSQIKAGRSKKDFDFMEVFQFVDDKKKKSFTEPCKDEESYSGKQHMIPLLRQAEHNISCFSGNMSFINTKEGSTKVIDVIEELLENKVMIKILCRINLASISNISKLSALMTKYPELIEVKHCYQPLRGFIIDDKIARFKYEEKAETYKHGELDTDTRIFYEVYDQEWVAWMQKVFWNLFRVSIDYDKRLKEIKKIF
jgi:hypothetical protein